MKKISIFAVAMLMFFTSCQTLRTYNFMQVLEATPVSANGEIKNVEDGMLYENADCIIFYKLWDDGGNAGFEIHNKTDEMLYLDLSKSFFIKNGIAYNYFLNREWGTASSSGSTQNTVSSAAGSSVRNYYAGNSGATMTRFKDPVVTTVTTTSYAAQTNSTTKSTVRKEEQIMSIPPHKSKMVAEYGITSVLVLDCAIERYPSEKSQSLTFDKDNTPVTFANYITYNKGEGTADKVIENEFYISSVVNYAEPALSEYVERKETCENLRHPDATVTAAQANSAYYTVYDKYLKAGVVSPSSFYIPYSVTSNKVIYEGKTYYWNRLKGGYTTYQSYY